MVGYRVGNTLSESGSVARGVCETNAEGFLTGVVERTAIERIDGDIQFTDENGKQVVLEENVPVSMNMGAKKNFVLDTNVILHDYKCIENFQENDIYIPIVVLEELDKFKKGSEQINYNAREFVRELDLLTDNDLFKKGASLGPGLGKLYIVTGDKYHERIAEAFPERIPDHRILS